MICQSYCKLTFHEKCLNQKSNIKQNQDLKTKEKKIQAFTCEDCQNNIGICFECKDKDELAVNLKIWLILDQSLQMRYFQMLQILSFEMFRQDEEYQLLR